MKKAKFRYQTTDDGAKKSILKFRDVDDETDDDAPDEESRDHMSRRRKDMGKRLHRKKTLKDDFWD